MLRTRKSPQKTQGGWRKRLVEYEENWLCTSGLHIVPYCGTLCVCYLQEHNVIHEIFSARWEISISLFIAKSSSFFTRLNSDTKKEIT